MIETPICHGIPDVELQRSTGGNFNPAHLLGHELVVLFCPNNPDEAANETEVYARHAQEFCDNDAWIVSVNNQAATALNERGDCGKSIVSTRDPEGCAWAEFATLLNPNDQSTPTDGAVFLFGRGGGLRRAWQGSGHVADVIRELEQRR